jgi:ribonuclease HII
MTLPRLCIAGVDEAGRGPLAGPVVAAAVVLGATQPSGLGDSKTKTARQRDGLYRLIMQEAHAVAIGCADAQEIDTLNIHHASLLAMQRAIAGLGFVPDNVLVDGKFCPVLPCPARAIVRGDASEPAISAASIIAKVHRDRIMDGLHRAYPDYGFDRHKGYPTAAHLRAIDAVGVCREHRRSFAPVRRVLALNGMR